MNYFVSEDSVKDSIKYFKDLQIHSLGIGIFLLFKRLGMSTTRPYNFKERDNTELLDNLHLMGAIFDENEVWEDGASVIFPMNINEDGLKKADFYNPSTSPYKHGGRLKDTVRNSNPSIFKQLDEAAYSLVRNYSDILQKEGLKNEKISLAQFAIWLFRFTAFNFKEKVDDRIFTRVVKKSVKDYLRLTDSDFYLVFEDDFPGKTIKASDNHISGAEFRDTLGINESNIASTFKQRENESSNQYNIIGDSKIERFSLATGDNPTAEQIEKILIFNKQLILVGVPGVGKSFYINQLTSRKSGIFNKFRYVQFHPGFTYEDFIGGETFIDGSIQSRQGILVKAIHEAIEHPNEKYLFVIDEINRGNVAEIFGETIQILDRQGYAVDLAKEVDGVRNLTLPDNLYIIGAMNSSDRSISLLDLAIRRRFAFVELFPNYELLSELSIFKSYDMGSVLEQINNRILELTGDNQKILGHSYLIKSGEGEWTLNELQIRFNNVILPTLKEYAFSDDTLLSGIIGSELSKTILDPEEFEEAFNREFDSVRKN